MGDDILDIFSGLPLSKARLANRPSLPAPPKRKKSYKAYEVSDNTQWKLRIACPGTTLGITLLSYACQNKIFLTSDNSRLDILFMKNGLTK